MSSAGTQAKTPKAAPKPKVPRSTKAKEASFLQTRKETATGSVFCRAKTAAKALIPIARARRAGMLSLYHVGVKSKGEWTVYIVRCRDGSFYTGIAKDVEARIAVHNSGKGAAYTRGRGPVTLRWSESGLTWSQALIREAGIKSLSRSEKKSLILNRR